jgi:hypothetical protein
MVEYFEQVDGTQPAEVFEDELFSTNKKMVGKLLQIIDLLKERGPQLGGGYIEKCRGYQGLWEIRIIYSDKLARGLFGFDGQRIVLLHGYLKRVGQPASKHDLDLAHQYWAEYLKTRLVSPVQEEEDNESI